MNCILLIDTAEFGTATLKLMSVEDEREEVLDSLGFESKKELSKKLLPQIDKFLRKNRIKLEDLAGIKINPGPGSFTGLRIGASVANALGFALGIPVNELPVGESVEPQYGKPPHITLRNGAMAKPLISHR